MKRYIYFAFVLLLALPAMAQKESSQVRKGNRQYNKEQYADAEVQYRKGLETNPQSVEAHFNLGDALFRQEKYPEAAAEWQRAAQQIVQQSKSDKLSDSDKLKLAQAYHNIGNACYAQQDFGKAVEAYQHSLMANPKDDETRYNLVKAMQMLEQQQQQQQQQQNQDQDQQQQQNQDQQQQQQQQQDQNENENEDQNQDEQQQQQPQQGDMDKEQAEQILQALQQDEQDTQDKAKRQQMQSKFRTDKDW